MPVPCLYRSPFPKRKGAGGLGLLLLLTILLSACSTGATPIPGATATPLLTYQWPDIALLEPSWVADHINAPDIRIIDVSDYPQYLLGHVPGAVHAYWQDLVELHANTYGRLAGQPEREKTFGSLGIEQKTLTIIYDRTDNRAAARFAWALWYAGHPNVRILNGGLAGWTAAGYAIEQRTHTAPHVFYRDLPDESLHINRCDMFKATTDPRAVILDVRTDAEMAQTWENTMRIGSIPNARRLPWTSFIRSPHLPAFRSPDELRAMLATIGATPDRTIAIYGTFSNDAALPFLALKALGYVNVKLYDGGWAEWGANPALPSPGPPCA
ncbi:MAG: rhodanese-like domain-containing protein [Chloroflexota bacterium]|nr:rhodanese-like domain-containing protein [Chloroflexota bacterium]